MRRWLKAWHEVTGCDWYVHETLCTFGDTLVEKQKVLSRENCIEVRVFS